MRKTDVCRRCNYFDIRFSEINEKLVEEYACHIDEQCVYIFHSLMTFVVKDPPDRCQFKLEHLIMTQND